MYFTENFFSNVQEHVYYVTPFYTTYSEPFCTGSHAHVNAHGTIPRRGGPDQYRMVLLASVNATVLYQSFLVSFKIRKFSWIAAWSNSKVLYFIQLLKALDFA